MGPPSNEERVYGFIDLFKQVGDAKPAQIYSLRTKEIKIGREHKCDIRIHNLRISRLQCCVNISGPEDNQKVRLRNLTSKTTTYYSNRNINLDEQVELKDGDRFRLYDTELRFRDFKANDPPPEAMNGKPIPVIRLAAKEKAGHHSSTPNKIPSLLKTPKSEKIKSSSPSRSSERMNKTMGSTPNGGRVEMDRTPKRRRSSDVELRKAVLQRRFRKSVQGKAFPAEISEGPEAEDDEEEDEDEQEEEEEGESAADQDSAKSAATNDTLLSDSLTESVPETNHQTSYIVPQDESVDLLAPVVVDPPAVSPKNQSQDLIEFADIEREMFELHEEGDKTNNNNNVQDTSSNAETSEGTSKAASSEPDQPIQVDVVANGNKDAEDTELLDSNVVVDINTEMDTQVINDFPGIIDDSFSSRWNDSVTTFGRSFHTAADNDEQDLSFEPMEVDEEPLNDQTGTTNADGSFYDACADQNVTDDMFSVIEAEDIPADPVTPVIQQSVEASTEELEILEDGVKDAEVNGNSASSSCEPDTDTQETATSSASQGSCFESVSIEQIEEDLADMFEPDEEEGGTERETIPETQREISNDDTAKKDDDNVEKGIDGAKQADDDSKKVDDDAEKGIDGAKQADDDSKKVDDDAEKADVEPISSSDSSITPEQVGESEASDPDVENRNFTVTSPVVETQDDSLGLGEIFSESVVEIVEVTETVESAENKETEDTETTSDDVVNEGSSVSVSDVESDEESPAVVATVEITEMDTQVIVEETETPVPEELELETEAEFAAEPVVLADKTVEEMDSLCFPDTPRQSVNVASTSLMPEIEENEVVEEPVEAGATSPVDSILAPEASRPSDSPAISSSEKQSAETPEVAITSDDEVTAIEAPSGRKRASVVTRRVSRSATASRNIVTISDSDEEQINSSEEPKDKTVKTPKSLFKKPTGTPIRTPAKSCRDTDDGDSSDDCVAIRSSALSTPRQTRGRQSNSDNDVSKRNAMTTPRARQTRTALRSQGFTTPSQKEQAKSSDSGDVEVIDCEPEMANTSLMSMNSEKLIVAEAELGLQEVNDESVAVNDESVVGNEESLARKDESVAINKESVARNEESVTGNDESVAIIEESVVRNEESVAEPAEMSLPTAESDIEDDLQSLADDAGSSKKLLKASDTQRSKIDIIMEDDEKSADGLGDPDISLDLEEADPEEEDDAEEVDEPDASASSDVDDEEVAKSPEIKLREFSVVLKRLEMDFDKSSSEEEEESEEELSASKSDEISFQDEEEGALETLAEDHESESDTSEREDEVPVARRRSKKSHFPLSLSEGAPYTSEVASTSRKSTGKSTAKHSSEADLEMVEIEEDAGPTSLEKLSSAHETSADIKSVPVRHHVYDVEMVEDEAESQEESMTDSRLTGDDEEAEGEESAEAHPKTSRRSAALKVSEAEDEEIPSNASPRKSSRRSSLKSVDSEEVATTSTVARKSRRSSKVAESERSRSSSRTPRRTASKETKEKEVKESSPESSPIKGSVGSTSKPQADYNESEGHEVTSPVTSSSKKLSTSKIPTEVSSPQLEARSSEPEGSSPEHEARSSSKSTEESPREPRKSYTTKYGIKYDASIKLRDLKIILDRLEETEEGRRRQPKRGENKGKESDKRGVEYVDLEDGSSDSETSEMSQQPFNRSARKSSSSTEVSRSGRRSKAKNSSSAEASDALEDDDEVETEPKVQEDEVPSTETPKRHMSNSPVRSSKKAVVEPTAPASSDENISEDNVQSQSDDLSDAETIPIKTTPRTRKPLIASKTPKSTPRRGRSTNPDVIVVENKKIEEEDEDIQEVDEDIEKEYEAIENEDDQPQKAHSSRSKRGKAFRETPKKAEAKKGRARKVPSADESEESSEESEKKDLDKQDAGKTRKAKAEPPSRGRNLRKHTISEASIETVAIESKKKKDQESKKPARVAKNAAAAEVDEEALEVLSSHGRKTRRNDIEVVKEIKSTRRGNKAKEPKDDEMFIEPEAPPTRGKRGQHEKKTEEPNKSPIKRSGRMKVPSKDASEEPVSSKRTRRDDHAEDEEESEAESVKAIVSKAVVTKSRQKQTITAQKFQEEDESDVEEPEERPKSRSDRRKKDADESSRALSIDRSKKQRKDVSPERPASRARGRSRKDDTDESSQERPASRARGRPRKNADESSSQERSDSSSSKVNERSTRRKPVEIVTIDEPVSLEEGRKQQKAKGGKKGQKAEEKSADKDAPKKPTSPPEASSSSRLKPKPVVELRRLNVPTRSPRVTRAQSTDAEPAAAPAPVQLPKRKKRGATQDPEENHDEEPPSDTESVSSRTRGRGTTKEPQEGTQSKGTRSKKIKNDPPAKATKPSKRKPPVEEVEIVEVNDEGEEEEAPKEKAKPKRATAKAKAAKAQERVNEAEEQGNESDEVEEPKTRSERRVKADSSKTKKPVAQVTNEEEPKAKRLRRADAKTTQVSKSSKPTRAKAVGGKSDDEEEEEKEQQGEKPQKSSKSTKRTRRAAEVEEEQEVVIAAETKRDRRKQPTAMETVAEEVPKPVRRGKTARQANAKTESTSRVVLQLPPDTNDDVIEISGGEEEERPQSRAKRARTDKDQVKSPVTVTATRPTRRRGK